MRDGYWKMLKLEAVLLVERLKTGINRLFYYEGAHISTNIIWGGFDWSAKSGRVSERKWIKDIGHPSF